MLDRDFVLRDRLTDARELVDLFDGIHLLHRRRFDVTETEVVQALLTEVGIVANVTTSPTVIRRLRGQNQISHLAINLGTINAAAEGSAIDVLLYLNAVHSIPRADFAYCQKGCARPHRSPRPPHRYRRRQGANSARRFSSSIDKPVASPCGKEEEGGVVVWRQTAIDENKSFVRIVRVPVQNLRREKNRRRRARSDELPKEE